MRLLQFDEISVEFPGHVLFDQLSWGIFRGEKYGLVGPNGAGKTTLFRLAVGVVEPSQGKLACARSLQIGYLPQEEIVHSGRTLFEEAWSGLPDLPALEAEIETSRTELGQNPDNTAVLDRLGMLESRWQDLGGYQAEANVGSVLTGLGFKAQDFQRPVEEFSGGWQMRIALSKVLLKSPDLLLLDEPTNHLDLPSLNWLEGHLKSFNGALILVSHDRRFLDRTVERIAELDHGQLTTYLGNYAQYEKARELRNAQLEAHAIRQAEERKRIERFIERFRYKLSKARQVQSRIKYLKKFDEIETKIRARRTHFRFPPAPHSGRIVLEAKDVVKSYDKLEVFRDIDVSVRRGEKIALVGVNGAGKSTFCRLIAGIDEPTTGHVKLGEGVKIDYFVQDTDFRLDGGGTVLEELEQVSGSADQSFLRGLLGSFLFEGDDVFKPVSVLSGGEKSRLALAKMLLNPSNLLILDEPTNHLDISSQQVLRDALSGYDGTLIIVSHDVAFLDGLVGRVFELEEGTLRDWVGSFSEYLERKHLFQDSKVPHKQVPETEERTLEETPARRSRELKRQEAEVRNRFSSDIKQAREEVDHLQSEIDQAERRIREIEEQLSTESFYKDNDQAHATVLKYKTLKTQISDLIQAWEKAEARLDDLQRQKNKALASLKQDSINP